MNAARHAAPTAIRSATQFVYTKLTAVLLSAVLLSPACNRSSSGPTPDATEATSRAHVESHSPAPTEESRFGSQFSGAPKAALQEILAAPMAYSGKTVEVAATVRRACSRKGCWMELAESADGAGIGCRVTFKDYGFFVPTDSAGRSARVEGAVVVKQVAASHVAHLESEGATFTSKNEDGSANEVQLVATAVALGPR